MINNVAIIAIGDPCLSTTWSGVPKRLVDEYSRRGYNVFPLNIASDFLWHWIGVVFNRVLRRIYFPWHRVSFCNTRLAFALSRFWLKRHMRKIGKIDLIVSTSFSVDTSGLNVITVMLHDWTEGYALLRSGNPAFNRCEEQSECNQLELLGKADLVVALYPASMNYLVAKGCNARYICNPINTESLSEEEYALRLEKMEDDEIHILAVGGSWYQSNVECVIKAADNLKDGRIIVDVIGRNSAKSIPKYCKVNFHGYLNKDDIKQGDLYRKLFLQARCLVNIRKGWGGGSSIAEAMFKYLPVIIGRYPDVESMYGGAESRFGYYCNEEDVEDLTCKLRKIITLSKNDYLKLCTGANEVVKNDTYQRLVDGIMTWCK